MKIKELIGKVLSGAELSPEELKHLQDYNEPENDNRIPKARLDQEISRKKELESKVSELNAQIEELRNIDLSDNEKNRKVIENLNKRVAALSEERDRIESEKQSIQFRNQVISTAGAHNFSDNDYLEFLLKRDQVDLGDEEMVSGFMESLKAASPQLFKTEVNPGGAGSSFGTEASGYEDARHSGDIDRMIALAPSVS